jgi:hypothetical protein
VGKEGGGRGRKDTLESCQIFMLSILGYFLIKSKWLNTSELAPMLVIIGFTLDVSIAILK